MGSFWNFQWTFSELVQSNKYNSDFFYFGRDFDQWATIWLILIMEVTHHLLQIGEMYRLLFGEFGKGRNHNSLSERMKYANIVVGLASWMIYHIEISSVMWSHSFRISKVCQEELCELSGFPTGHMLHTHSLTHTHTHWDTPTQAHTHTRIETHKLTHTHALRDT